MSCTHCNLPPCHYVGRFGNTRCLRHELQLRHAELSLLELSVSRNTLVPYYESRNQIRRWLFTQEFTKIQKHAPLFWYVHADLFENKRVGLRQPSTMQPTVEQLRLEYLAAMHARLTYSTSTLLGKRPRIWDPSPYKHDVRDLCEGTSTDARMGHVACRDTLHERIDERAVVPGSPECDDPRPTKRVRRNAKDS